MRWHHNDGIMYAMAGLSPVTTSKWAEVDCPTCLSRATNRCRVPGGSFTGPIHWLAGFHAARKRAWLKRFGGPVVGVVPGRIQVDVVEQLVDRDEIKVFRVGLISQYPGGAALMHDSYLAQANVLPVMISEMYHDSRSMTRTLAENHRSPTIIVIQNMEGGVKSWEVITSVDASSVYIVCFRMFVRHTGHARTLWLAEVEAPKELVQLDEPSGESSNPL